VVRPQLAPTAAVKVDPVHAADVRLQAARQLRRLLVSRLRLVRARLSPPSPSSSRSFSRGGRDCRSLGRTGVPWHEPLPRSSFSSRSPVRWRRSPPAIWRGGRRRPRRRPFSRSSTRPRRGRPWRWVPGPTRGPLPRQAGPSRRARAPAPGRLEGRQRRPRPGGGRHGRGVRHRRSAREGTSRRTPPGSTWRRPAPSSRTTGSGGCVFGVYLRERERCPRGGVRKSAASRGATPARRRSRNPHLRHRRLHADTATRSRMSATASTSSRRGTGTSRRTRTATSGTAFTTCSRTTNVFEDKPLENGAAGTALMYSRRITFRRNRFLHNRGFASVRAPLQDLRRRPGGGTISSPTNARGILSRGFRPEPLRAERRGGVRHRHRPLRLVPRRRFSPGTSSSRTCPL